MAAEDERPVPDWMLDDRLESLKIHLKAAIPDLLDKCEQAKKTGAMLVFHQDSFAADYQDEEYLLLSMFLKYAGAMGVEVLFTGKNRQTYSSREPCEA